MAVTKNRTLSGMSVPTVKEKRKLILVGKRRQTKGDVDQGNRHDSYLGRKVEAAREKQKNVTTRQKHSKCAVKNNDGE